MVSESTAKIIAGLKGVTDLKQAGVCTASVKLDHNEANADARFQEALKYILGPSLNQEPTPQK